MSPRDITTKYLLDGDDSIPTGEFGPAPQTGTDPIARSTAEPMAPAPDAAIGFQEKIDPANCGIVRPSEPVDPANCGVVDPDTWEAAEPTLVPELPRIDTDAT